MKTLLRVFVCAAMLTMLAAGFASAGQNAGATARMYWLSATTATTGLASRDNSNTTVYGLVVVKGLNNFRGADVQLVINSLDASGLPEAWQAQSGGPADGCWTPKSGGWKTGTSTVWPNVFTASPALPGVAVGQDGTMKFALTGTSACVTPHDVGVIWLSQAGSAAVARTAAKEYGAFGFIMDFTVVPGLVGGPDNNPKGVCINSNWRLSCGVGEHGNVMAVVDSVSVKDFAAFDVGYEWLTWNGALGGSPGCPTSTPVGRTTWGRFKHLYK
jgi:hypothetical protein